MLLKLRPIQSISLGSAFFFLSIKGVDEVFFTATDATYAINYPIIVNILKDYGLIIGSLSLSIYALVSIFLGKFRRLNVPIGLFGIICPVTFYFFRSAAVGDNWAVNIMAILFTLVFFYCSLLSLKLEKRSLNNWNWYHSLLVFFTVYILATFTLFLSGYGYLEIGNRRFFGLASHPNSLGQVASLAFSFFVLSTLNPELSKRKKLNIALSLIALSCAFLSGSRAAILMCGICALAFPGRIFIVLFIVSLLASLTVGIDFSSEGTGSFSLAMQRMLSAPLDNRNEIWSSLWLDFLRYPMWGVGDTTAVSGSAYLTALAGTGFVFGAIYIYTLFWLATVSFNKLLVYKITGQYTPELICVVALLQLIAGGFFEARLFDKLSHMPLIFFLSAAVVLSSKKSLKA